MGLPKKMGVIGPKGIIGIVNQTSNGYASVLSILNQDIKINAKFKTQMSLVLCFGRENLPMKWNWLMYRNQCSASRRYPSHWRDVSYFPEGIVMVKSTPLNAKQWGILFHYRRAHQQYDRSQLCLCDWE